MKKILLLCLFYTNILHSQIKYDYDNLNRLKKIDYGNGTAIEYVYDAVGNRKTQIITSQQTTYSISGKINYYSNTNLPVPDVTITLSGNGNHNQKTGSSGNYQFTSISGGNYTGTPSKNSDLTNGISGMDASRAARFAAGIISLNTYEMIAADVSGNGSISGTDASKIARYAAGIIDEYQPGQPDWKFVPEPITDYSNWPPIQYSSTRAYSPLQADQTNQNFIAIRAGDVTGNWSLDDNNLAKNAPLSEIIKMSVTPALENIAIPIEISQPVQLESIDLKVNYEPDKLTFKELVLNESIIKSSDYESVINSETEGEITLVIFCISDNFYSGYGKIGELLFGLQSNEGLSTPVQFIKYNINENSIQTWIYQVENSLPTTFALFQNYPNPFNSTTTICYDLPEVAHVFLAVYNIQGQVVNILKDEIETPGHKRFRLETENLSSGVYFYHLVTKSTNQKESFNKINKLLLLK